MTRRRIGTRIAAGALALSLTAGLPAAALSSWFSPPSGWAAADLERAEDEGLLTSAYLSPDLQGEITRAEFAGLAVTLTNRLLGLSLSPDAPDAPFTDTDSYYVRLAWSMGLMNGESGTVFNPNRPITRMEICTLLSRVMEKCGVDLPERVPGVAGRLDSGAEGAVPGWARDGVVDIVGAGLMQGGDNGSLALNARTTREQAVVLALRAMELGGGALEAEHFTAAEREQIARLNELRASFGDPGAPYAQAPSVEGFSPGVLNETFLQDGLNAINYVRAVAGLEAVSMTRTGNDAAQVGALLLAAGEFSHTPGQPAGMPDNIYQQGREITFSSNIGRGYDSLSQFTLSCMDDSDRSNIDRVGHRRWLLDPTLTTVSLGYVEGNTTTRVMDDGYRPWSGPDHVTWPAEGLFPMELLDSGLAWSCSVDPGQYQADAKGLTVTAADGSGNTWSGSAAGSPDFSGDFVVMEGGGYGGAPAVIFRPEGLEYRAGQTVTVTISGLKLVGGGAGTITYTVKLF